MRYRKPYKDTVSCQVRIPDCPALMEIAALPTRAWDARRKVGDDVLLRWLPELQRNGVAAKEADRPTSGKQRRVLMSQTTYMDVLRVASSLGVTDTVVIREAFMAATQASDRVKLEMAYREAGHPGDPRALSTEILRVWISEPRPSPELAMIRDLTIRLTYLERRVDFLVQKYENTGVTIPAQALLRMSNTALRGYLRRLGVLTPRGCRREDLFTLIRKKEEELGLL